MKQINARTRYERDILRVESKVVATKLGGVAAKKRTGLEPTRGLACSDFLKGMQVTIVADGTAGEVVQPQVRSAGGSDKVLVRTMDSKLKPFAPAELRIAIRGTQLCLSADADADAAVVDADVPPFPHDLKGDPLLMVGAGCLVQVKKMKP
jgi:hypothetical protein